jgi:cobyrinic acid a,c-diamide synthase
MNRLFVSAAHKSSGKTTTTIGIASALSARGRVVQTFKKGPDYIDPMWLARASGRACFNLDFNTQEADEIRATFAGHLGGADIALIEGNKGLHDGLDTEGGDSSAALARLLGAPVVLVVDVVGMTRGIAPLLMGYRVFDPSVRLAGVILNKVVSPRQETKLRQAIERYTDLAVLGAVGRDREVIVGERHLGLTTPDETEASERVIAAIRARIEQGVDLDRLMTIAAEAPKEPWLAAARKSAAPAPDLRVAVARDAAFGFYYPDDLAALERAGARLVFFDTMTAAAMPEADGLLIGGGFPETHTARLAANAALRADIARRIRAGLPTYAECGGLMYLSRSIAWRGETFPMVGVIAADTVMRDRPQGRGLVVIEETEDAPWRDPQGTSARVTIAAHEFHYAALENLDPATRFAYAVRRGHGIDGRHDGIVVANTLASFTHLRDTSRCHWAERFVDFIRRRHRAAGSAARAASA